MLKTPCPATIPLIVTCRTSYMFLAYPDCISDLSSSSVPARYTFRHRQSSMSQYFQYLEDGDTYCI